MTGTPAVTYKELVPLLASSRELPFESEHDGDKGFALCHDIGQELMSPSGRNLSKIKYLLR